MPETHQDAAGTQFGKYFLLKKLAAGGMGEIYVAKQQGPAGFQKIQVVKKILPHLTENKEFIEAFLGEARLAAQMNHRNIVQVFELGEHHGAYFIAMEYVQGKSLRDLIDAQLKRRERLHPELARLVAEQICDGASYAHNLTDMTGRSLNLVHRDLNPQNVLISYTGDVKVIDFGIAKSEMSTVKTEAGMIKGKFVYMSPEQSMAKKLDKRSDIFAIGITLYEMLTGINPFQKNNIVLTLEAVQRFEPPPPSQHDPVYAPFDPIVAKALTKDRDRRYHDASEMQDDLRRVILPRPNERLAQVMQRLFRTQLEEEQKILMDTDQRRLVAAAAAAKKTPSKPVATPARPQPARQTQPESQAPDGSTMLLPNVQARKAPSGPLARAPAAPKKTVGDTLIDMDEPPPPAADAADDAPGATAFLSPGMQQPPPPRKPAVAPTGTLPHVSASDLPAATAARPPARKAPRGGESTDILTAEESAKAQRDALAKLAAAKNQVVRTRTRDQASTAASAARKTGRNLWIALGAGGLSAIVLLAGLIFFLVQEEAPERALPKKQRGESAQRREEPSAPDEQVSSPVGDTASTQRPPRRDPSSEEKAKPAPKKTSPAPAPSPAEQRPDKPAEKTAARHGGKVLGTLQLNPGPNISVSHDGTAYPKQVGAFNLPITSENGQIEIGDAQTPFRVTLDYAIAAGILSVKVDATPWGIAAVDGPTRGKTPVSGILVETSKPTVVELGKPGQQGLMRLSLTYKPN